MDYRSGMPQKYLMILIGYILNTKGEEGLSVGKVISYPGNQKSEASNEKRDK